MTKKVILIASNYGLWAEELQGPWDALKNMGCELTLATKTGKTPLPLQISMDPEMVDPIQKYKVNPQVIVNSVKEILTSGEWDQAIKIEDVDMDNFDALVIVGGPGAPLDLTGNPFIHKLLLKAYKENKTIGAICYAVAALAFTRDPDNQNKSIIYNKSVTAHPHAWDFDFDLSYDLYMSSTTNPGTDLVTPGFVFPLQYMVEDAVGDPDKVKSDETANREKPCIAHDPPFVTALSVESSIAFGQKLVEVLSQ